MSLHSVLPRAGRAAAAEILHAPSPPVKLCITTYQTDTKSNPKPWF